MNLHGFGGAGLFSIKLNSMALRVNSRLGGLSKKLSNIVIIFKVLEIFHEL